MSGFNIRDTVKKGWHPKGNDGKSNESWRGDFKGIDQVVSMQFPRYHLRSIDSRRPACWGRAKKRHTMKSEDVRSSRLAL